MKTLTLVSLGLLTIGLQCYLSDIASLAAQVPPRNPPAGNQPPDLFGPGQGPFRDDPNNLVPPDPRPRNGGGAGPMAPAAPPNGNLRNPLIAEPDVRAILDPPTEAPNRDQAPVPRLSGRVSLAGGKTMAVIEVNGNFWIVGEGDRIDFSVGNRGVETLTVVTLSPARVEVKFEQDDQLFQLR